MKCPVCNYPNPAGAEYCDMCKEVFNRTAAERYYHEQRRLRRDHERGDGDSNGHSSPTVTIPAGDIVKQQLAKVNWGGMWNRASTGSGDFVRTYSKELALAAAIVILGSCVMFFTSKERRLQVFGARLDYIFRPGAEVPYLVTCETVLKSWSERGGRLDTPLEDFTKDEMGNVVLKAGARKKLQEVWIHPKEWIITQTGHASQNVPLNHPTLKPVYVTLNTRGRIVGGDKRNSIRLGRALTFLMPGWPLKAHRTGDTWTEPVEWLQNFNDWKILWRGTLNWEVLGFDEYQGHVTTHLSYSADAQPTLWAGPSWAKGGLKDLRFSGTARGDTYFDMEKRQMLSNVFVQDGVLSMSIDSVFRIPAELRVGRTPRHRWGESVQAEPGKLFIQIKETLDAHRP